jgi:hypothetical protein
MTASVAAEWVHDARERTKTYLWRHPVLRRLALTATRPPVPRGVLVRCFEDDLRRLHDALAATGLLEYMWVWSGLLLGWAREGAVLRHDARDADFCVHEQEVDRLVESLGVLDGAGFRLWCVYRANDGHLSEIVLRRRFAHFDFFVVEDAAPGWWSYQLYGTAEGATQFTALLPAQRLEPFDFLGRTWLKVADHDRELTELYGNWRLPNPSWDCMRDGRFIAREPWHNRPTGVI